MRARRIQAAALASLLLCLGLAGSAAAYPVPWPPDLLTQVPSPDPESGESAQGEGPGEFNNPRAIGVDGVSGHLFVADGLHARISEFTAWGEFVKAWGWGVLDGEEEAQVCTEATGCVAGAAGDGAGQLARPNGVAVDSAGNVYVHERTNRRISKFDPAGQFVWTVGGEVDKTTGENLCTAASGDECGIGLAGAGPAEFETTQVGPYIAIDAETDAIYVGDKERIQIFNPAGAYAGEIGLEEVPGLPKGTVRALAVGPEGNLRLAVAGTEAAEEEERVFEVNPAGPALEGEIEVEAPRAVAVDSGGRVYAVSDPGSGGTPATEPTVHGFDAAGAPLDPVECCGAEVAGLLFPPSPLMPGLATSSACGVASDQLIAPYFHAENQAFLRLWGPAPQTIEAPCDPPPEVPPDIEDQFATAVGAAEATLAAQINPRFWPDTTYYLQYGTAPCSEGGCAEQPPPPGEPLTEGIVSASIRTEGIALSGLAPDTTYHYRFVAQSSGGGPVFGVGGDEEEAGAEGTFKTYPLPAAPKTDCPNQAHRTGPSAALAECRAYELVSPLDKGNGDIVALGNINSDPARLNQSAASGDKLTYSSYRAFADPEGAPFTSQYIATRAAGEAWETEAISPPRNASLLNQGDALDSQYKLFSADLCDGYLLYDSQPPLDPAVPAGFASIYRRAGCAGGGYEGLAPVQPPNRTVKEYVPRIQGASADGAHVAFRANDKLAVDSGPEPPELGAGNPLAYESHLQGGERRLRYVCVLPGEVAFGGGCSVGTASSANNRSSRVHRAMSANGSRIYWTAADIGPGKLYLRIDGAETKEVSETVSASPARFLSASTDGSLAIFSVGEDLYRYSLAEEEATQIAGEAKGILGASADAGRVYLVSAEELTPGQENSEGDEAIAGRPNLYLWEAGEGGGTFDFVGTLSIADAREVTGPGVPSPVNNEPFKRTSRVTPSGSAAAFMSSARLTGHANTDLASGKADAFVFHYDAATGKLSCPSCHPGGARPRGENITGSEGQPFWAAATIPTWETQLYAPRALSEDGSRLFFESFEALVLADTNGARDVYEFRVASEASCEAAGADLHLPEAGGCISLLSSGQSPSGARFIDASAEGRDAFIATQEGLLDHDPGLLDVYDARAGGGLPAPPKPRPECEGSACQSPDPPPAAPAPASIGYRGAGNLPGPVPSCKAPARRAKRLSRQAGRLGRSARRARRLARRASGPAARRAARKAKRMRGARAKRAKRAKRASGRAKRCRRRARGSAGRAR